MDRQTRISRDDTRTLFLCGDVMTGRGVDQILPNSGDPELYETHVRDAGEYVQLAERENGPVSRPVNFDYIWGDALEILESIRPDARIINLETAVTRAGTPWKGKRVHYRMHPDNVECLTTADIDACSLANNHTLDWGIAGLQETLDTIDRSGIKRAGAGRNLDEAIRPAVINPSDPGRILVFACGSPTAGVPPAWEAGKNKPGIQLVGELSASRARRIADRIRETKRPEDISVVSLHLGSNWGYRVPQQHRKFARSLIDHGVADLIHGHSSHHVRPFEVYRGKLILYGCGDFINDYEGIQGQEEFRDDLVLMYIPEIRVEDGTLASLQLFPLRIKKMHPVQTTEEDARWLVETLNRVSEPPFTRVELTEEGILEPAPD